MPTASATVTLASYLRDDFQQEQKRYPIPLTSLKVWDAMHTTLPGTPASDDCALVTGTPGTDVPTIQTTDPGGTSVTQKFAYEFTLPPEYVAGEAVSIQAYGACLTTVADGTCTVDFAAYKASTTGSAGSDLVSTAAQSINSLTHAAVTFNLTTSSLSPGDKVVVVGTMAANDAGNLGAMVPELASLDMLVQVKG